MPLPEATRANRPDVMHKLKAEGYPQKQRIAIMLSRERAAHGHKKHHGKFAERDDGTAGAQG